MLKRKMEDKIRHFFETQNKALLITGARHGENVCDPAVCENSREKSGGTQFSGK